MPIEGPTATTTRSVSGPTVGGGSGSESVWGFLGGASEICVAPPAVMVSTITALGKRDSAEEAPPGPLLRSLMGSAEGGSAWAAPPSAAHAVRAQMLRRNTLASLPTLGAPGKARSPV